MFYGCEALTSLDLSHFNAAKVTSMTHMFHGCKAMTEVDMSNFNALNVEDMSFMFYYCDALKSLDLSSFNVAKLTNMSFMFYNCVALTSLNLSNFNAPNVEDMSYMFYSCMALKSLDLSKFNTANVTAMIHMFHDCTELKVLNLGSFDISNVFNTESMFENCAALTTIYCSDDWSKGSVTDHNDMFKDCTNLKGGNGTTYDAGKTDIEYARPDGVDGKKGYFTEAKAFAVRFKDWDGTILKKEDVLNGQSATAPKDPTRDGYIFLGWDEDFTCVTKDLTVTAMYQKKTTFTVRFEDWDGTLLKKETVEKGQDATAPKDPVRDRLGQGLHQRAVRPYRHGAVQEDRGCCGTDRSG